MWLRRSFIYPHPFKSLWDVVFSFKSNLGENNRAIFENIQVLNQKLKGRQKEYNAEQQNIKKSTL